MSDRKCRKDLLQWINAVSFAVVEAQLFLDTHPTDRGALECYGKYQKIYDMLVKEFEEKFGALRAEDVEINKGWTWVNNPWPWEMEA